MNFQEFYKAQMKYSAARVLNDSFNQHLSYQSKYSQKHKSAGGHLNGRFEHSI